ncbi:MAG: hypothetical protein NC453_08855 [Muribaculum sp.]|nr:hypothetical protein [Muribaculum sp.]
MGNIKKRMYTCIRSCFMLLPESIIRKYEMLIEHRLKKKFYNSLSISQNNIGNSIIAVVDDKVNAGGLSDRLNGIISTFKISQLVGYKYYISHTTPFKLEEFLVPNLYNWMISPLAISFNHSQSYPIYIRSLNNPNINKRITSFRKAISNLGKIGINQYHCYTNLLICTEEEFHQYFNTLFKPSFLLQNAIDVNKNNINGKYVSVTFRFQQLLGDFKEGNFPILDINEREEIIKDCLQVVVNLFKKHPDHKVLVTSDSITFLNRVNTMPNVYTIPGKLVHMAYTADNSISTHLKSFVDLFMIANADKIYLVVSDKLYNSGFPRLASKIYLKPFEQINL